MSKLVECKEEQLAQAETGWKDQTRMNDEAAYSGPSQEDLARLLRELKEIPEPNFGRIQELKDRIKNKTLITKESVNEAAMHLAARFLGKE